MDWIKKHYDQVCLALAALALLAVAALCFSNVKSFSDQFAAARANVVPGDKIPPLDLEKVKTAEVQVEQPAVWKKAVNPFIFVPDIYWISDTKKVPEKPIEGSKYNDSLTGKPIPNTFFTRNSLPLLDPNVAKEDPDKDGFNNEDEWRGARDPSDPNSWHDPTNPNDANSHPPYVTKLFLKQWIRVPFRLLFQAYDGDPKKDKPEAMSFQINAVDRGRKTEFLKLGEKVANSPYRLERFEYKEKLNEKTGEMEDKSELTVKNTETGDEVTLILGTQIDSPDSYGLFDYQFTGKDIQVKKLQQFILLPEKDKLYKLIDIKDDKAVVQLPDEGGNYIVVRDPRKK